MKVGKKRQKNKYHSKKLNFLLQKFPKREFAENVKKLLQSMSEIITVLKLMDFVQKMPCCNVNGFIAIEKSAPYVSRSND